MGYVLLEIVVPIIVAFLIGLLLGWLLWRWRREKVTYSEWETSGETTTSAFATGAAGAATVGAATTPGHNAELEAAKERIVTLEGELTEARSAAASATARAGVDAPVATTVGTARETTARAGFADLDGTAPAGGAATASPSVGGDAPSGNGGAAEGPYGAGSMAPFADPREVPAGFPIKGNIDSMLYHRTDSRNYGATIAEVYFNDSATAEAAGFTLAPTHPSTAASSKAGDAASASVPDGPYGPGSLAPSADPRQVPDGYPIKGNVDSMYYHRPDSRSYRATIAEVYFASPDDAEAAGFSLAATHKPAAMSRPHGGSPSSPGGPYGPGSVAPLADPREVPAGFPIKGNIDSMLYHRTDSRNYGATIAEVYFDTVESAENAGFALAPNHPSA
ncbi:MAG: hypothetical protein ACR2OD_05425 [Gaiellaceae bacterium]